MNMTQRTATMEDADIILAWRNHPSSREFSRQTEQIHRDEHVAWLAARLKKVQMEPFYLFIENNSAVGMSRLDALSESIDKYEISILIDPSQHGKGLGTKILGLTCETIFSLHPKHTIVAHIHEDNYSSQKLFRSAGFELLPSIGGFLRFEKSLN